MQMKRLYDGYKEHLSHKKWRLHEPRKNDVTAAVQSCGTLRRGIGGSRWKTPHVKSVISKSKSNALLFYVIYTCVLGKAPGFPPRIAFGNLTVSFLGEPVTSIYRLFSRPSSSSRLFAAREREGSRE